MPTSRGPRIEVTQPRGSGGACTCLSDEKLVSLILKGDQIARNLILERYYKALRRYARRVTTGSDEADDLVHDALLKSLHEMESLRKPRCFLRRAMQFIADHEKTLRRFRRRNLVMADGTEWESIESLHVDPPTLREIDRELLRDLLSRIASQSSGHPRSIGAMMLRHFGEYGRLPSLRQMEVELGISHGQAQRSRRQILDTWQRICLEVGLYTVATQAAINQRTISGTHRR